MVVVVVDALSDLHGGIETNVRSRSDPNRVNAGEILH